MNEAELQKKVVEYEALIRDLTEALRAQAVPPPPMECKTDAEKIAYAFGWNKCMELHRRMNGDHRSFREVYIPDWPDTKSGMILRLDLERANKHGDWIIPYADFPLKLKEKNT